jgi:hypothetical protein
LSVIHYIPKEEVGKFLSYLSEISINSIIELPSMEESEVAEKNRIMSIDYEKLLHKHFTSVKEIGVSKSPKDPNTGRKIFLCSNGNIKRMTRSYVRCKAPAVHTLERIDNKWLIDGKEHEVHGVNYVDLLSLSPTIFFNSLPQIAKRYHELIKERKGRVTDMNIHNVIVGANGAFPIDYEEPIKDGLYGLSKKEHLQKVKSLTEEQIFNSLRDQLVNYKERYT